MLRTLRILPMGFSKYCIGSAITNLALKRNRILSKLRQIEKISVVWCTKWLCSKASIKIQNNTFIKYNFYIMEDIETLDLLGTPLMEGYNLITMLLRFSFNMLVVWLMIHCLYYPKSGRRDYYFTFMLISISIFFWFSCSVVWNWKSDLHSACLLFSE